MQPILPSPSSTPSGADDGSRQPAGIAAAVRAFYDRHPYPPPIADLDAYRKRWDDARRRADAHLFLPGEPHRDDRSVLVAGCGTVQAVRCALRWPKAHIVGIDVSRTSLREADALRRTHRLDNLELRSLPVERADELGRTFHHVVCTGVLHHLPDPDAGLRALRTVLDPRGAMHLMVYAPYGRVGIYLLQDYCRRLGIGTTRRDLLDLAGSIRTLPHDHPLLPLMRTMADFWQPAGLADALLNPHDRPMSVPQLLDLLDRNGLRFGRWVRQAPYLPQCGAVVAPTHLARLARLSPAGRYAAMELLRGTMTRHSAVVHRSDGPGTTAGIDFTGERWRGCIPLRVPGTIVVRERLPAGAAAVLINPSHEYTDLYLPIDAGEAALVAVIDGHRPLGAIARADGDAARTRSLFERLWWYDQVVFDTSSAGDAGEPRVGVAL